MQSKLTLRVVFWSAYQKSWSHVPEPRNIKVGLRTRCSKFLKWDPESWTAKVGPRNQKKSVGAQAPGPLKWDPLFIVFLQWSFEVLPTWKWGFSQWGFLLEKWLFLYVLHNVTLFHENNLFMKTTPLKEPRLGICCPIFVLINEFKRIN